MQIAASALPSAVQESHAFTAPQQPEAVLISLL